MPSIDDPMRPAAGRTLPRQPAPGHPRHAAVYAKLVLVALIWGGTFIAGRVATLEVAPASAALWRYVIASVAVAILHGILAGRLPRLTARQWLGVTLLGALRKRGRRRGVASLCIGGGEATAIGIELC
jgi:hypothetical protein